MAKEHHYPITVRWTGNSGTGTSGYRAYSRNHVIEAEGRPALEATSDPAFRGDPSRYNPEQLLVAAIASCHMLWYLHLCADAGIVVTAYQDAAGGVMVEEHGGAGQFREAVLRPVVTLAARGRAAEAEALHEKAHHLCFIARSVNFPVRVEPRIVEPEMVL